MNMPPEFSTSAPGTRRDFLRGSGVFLAAGAAIAGGVVRAGPVAESNTIRIALIGCGGRGTGAVAQALSTAGPTQLWAVADVFEDRIHNTLAQLGKEHASQLQVPPERQFVGFDAYRRAIDSLDRGSVVLLTTPPAFRPGHLEYAVERGMHVFMEKSFAVDAPGIRRVLKAGEAAERKGLKIAGGLMSRHSRPLEEAVSRIHDGAIGEVITCYAYREHGPVGFAPRAAGMSELAHQIRNYSNFTWLNGSFIVDWLIHNIDVCCWVKNAWPESAQGMGGRQVRTEPDQLFDHVMSEYSFADGTRLVAQGRHMGGCWSFFGDVIHGTTGCAVLGEGQPRPRIYKGHRPTPENLVWDYKGPPCDAYQVEHDLFFEAIRQNHTYNETVRCARSCMTAIVGRMACESGDRVVWEEALNSSTRLAPGLESITSLGDTAPVSPDASGRYPLPTPGLRLPS